MVDWVGVGVGVGVVLGLILGEVGVGECKAVIWVKLGVEVRVGVCLFYLYGSRSSSSLVGDGLVRMQIGLGLMSWGWARWGWVRRG